MLGKILGRKKKTDSGVGDSGLPEFAAYPGSARRPWNEIPLGVSASGEVAWDVKKTPTLTVIGSTGAGKDVLMRNAIVHASQHSQDWEVWGVDIFHHNLGPYKHKYGVIEELALTIESGAELCESLCDVLRERCEQMKEAGVNDFRDLPDKPKAILLLITEAGIFLNRIVHPKSKRKAEASEEWQLEVEHKTRASQALYDLSRMGRAAGIYILMHSDNYSMEVLPNFQLGGYIVMTKMAHPPKLQRYVGDREFNPEPVSGRALFQPYGEERTLFQSYFADPSEWLYEVNDYNSNYKGEDEKITPKRRERSRCQHFGSDSFNYG